MVLFNTADLFCDLNYLSTVPMYTGWIMASLIISHLFLVGITLWLANEDKDEHRIIPLGDDTSKAKRYVSNAV